MDPRNTNFDEERRDETVPPIDLNPPDPQHFQNCNATYENSEDNVAAPTLLSSPTQKNSISVINQVNSPTASPAIGAMSSSFVSNIAESRTQLEVGIKDAVPSELEQVNNTVEDSTKPTSWTSGTPSLSTTITIKFLVSNNMAGSIIGRSGQTISDLQERSSARIKLSQNGDCYPGTSDRVCLVQGKISEVKKATNLILEKLYELQQQQAEMQVGRYSTQHRSSHHQIEEDVSEYHGQDTELQSNTECDEQSQKSEAAAKVMFSVRILLPAPSCGMLIGKAGSNIKLMKETSAVNSIRLSPRREQSSSTERILTIAANDLQCCVNCTHLVLNGIAAHPEICRYANTTTSYSKAQSSSVVNPRHSGIVPPSSGIVPSPNVMANVPHHHSSQLQASSAQKILQPASDANLQQCQNLQPIDQLQRRIQHTLRVGSENHSGFDATFDYTSLTSQQQEQVQQPFYDSNSSSFLTVGGQTSQQHEINHTSTERSQTSVTPGVSSHAINSPIVPVQQSVQLQPSSQVIGAVNSERPQNPSTQGQLQQSTFTVKMAIPDPKIGAVMGRRGQTLAELKSRSHTSIKISQRGVFVPGSNDRIVTISGSTAESVETAQALIRQYITNVASDREYSPVDIQHPMHSSDSTAFVKETQATEQLQQN